MNVVENNEKPSTVPGGSSHCLIIRVDKLDLIVPRILVAEVTDLDGVAFSSSPSREIKVFEWRGYQVPLINGSVFSPDCDARITEHSKVIIFHGVLNHGKLPFYAFVASKNPRLVMVSAESILEDQENTGSDASEVLWQVEVEGEDVAIPKVDYIEKYIHDELFQ